MVAPAGGAGGGRVEPSDESELFVDRRDGGDILLRGDGVPGDATPLGTRDGSLRSAELGMPPGGCAPTLAGAPGR
eukprot:8445291-Pyramimonas_sp.AAC.1